MSYFAYSRKSGYRIKNHLEALIIRTYIRMLYDSEKEWSGTLHENDRVSLLQQQQEQQQYSIQEIGTVAPHRTHTKVLHAGQMGLYYDDWFT